MVVRAIDCWVNINIGEGPAPEFLRRVTEDYFRKDVGGFKPVEMDEMLAEMDEAGVEKAVLNIDASRPHEKSVRFSQDKPDRFALSVSCNPRKTMEEVWRLEELARTENVVLARIIPFMHDLPPTDALYYPFYSKCVEIDLPLAINTGIPGPPVPGECQNPMYLDTVCLHFPDLRLSMAHGADPWWGIATRLMIKYKNLHLMTTAYAPKYLPPELIHFMNTRGQDKIMFGSDHPLLTMKRCIDEAQAIDFREGVLDKYLYANAEKFLFAKRKPRY